MWPRWLPRTHDDPVAERTRSDARPWTAGLPQEA